MEMSADRSTTEPTTDGGDTDQGKTAPDGTDAGAELSQLEDRWRRSLADLDNLRKRYAKDLDRERAAEVAKVSAAWLPILDNLELALAHTGSDPQSVVDGVKAIRDQAVQVLSRLGFERHDEVGVPFSPELHEVVSVITQPDLPSGTVVEVLRPGYGEDGRQLRPAAVVVSRPEG
ncbi:nucleotide exchange factor GrpE [Williamsia sp. 1135]|uniref:nucleotide exchange factor GrpE n=1 Tax=Williamsia sp. 1135 TaxID=1889262 RepID=UPI000A113F08|nr:nucleotide exchange factor GrpE [Williamsia sp. 1135]ORM35711.1 nucleotide exchange factor GrpE [Williamsia sp. 1135]